MYCSVFSTITSVTCETHATGVTMEAETFAAASAAADTVWARGLDDVFVRI